LALVSGDCLCHHAYHHPLTEVAAKMETKTKAWVVSLADEVIAHVQNAKRYEFELLNSPATFEYIRAESKAETARNICEDTYKDK
jgi:hypothetical protein